MLKLIKSKQTRWEELEAKKQQKIQAKANLERMLEAALDELKQATVAGKSTTELREIIRNTKEGLEALQEEINLLEQEQAQAELDYLQAKMQELERQEQKVVRDLEPHRKAYEQAKAEFEKAEKTWFARRGEAQEELDRIARQKSELKPRLDLLTPQATPEPQHSVEEWLQLCRDGKVTAYFQGNDPNLDEAYRLYEREKEEIRRWAAKAAVAKQSTGETPSMPEIVKHYSRERLREIIKTAKPEAARLLFLA